MIGDTKISAPLDEQLMNVLCHRTFTLTIDLLDIQATKILQQPHTVRPDNPQDVIRSQEADTIVQVKLILIIQQFETLVQLPSIIN